MSRSARRFDQWLHFLFSYINLVKLRFSSIVCNAANSPNHCAYIYMDLPAAWPQMIVSIASYRRVSRASPQAVFHSLQILIFFKSRYCPIRSRYLASYYNTRKCVLHWNHKLLVKHQNWLHYCIDDHLWTSQYVRALTLRSFSWSRTFSDWLNKLLRMD